MNEDFPKYQYSVFLKNGRDEQIVIRTNTFEDLLHAKKNINKILEKVENGKASTPFNQLERSCPDCAEPLKEGMTKNGKPFVKCSANRWDVTLGKAVGCTWIEWGNK